MANYLAPEDDPVNYLPARVNPNLAAQGRRYNLAERQQTSPLMQAGNVQFAKELSSMGNRGSVTDLINRGLIANTAGLPVDMLNTVLQTLGLGSEQPLGGSDSIRRALEYYGLSSETQRPMLETLASLTPPRAVMGAARVAGQGAEAVGRAAAPVAGQALENYMVRTGGILPMDTWHGSPHRFPPTAKNPLGEFDASKIGTGEGAQAYGHGLYLAENPAVAAEYRKTLGPSAGVLRANPNSQLQRNVQNQIKRGIEESRDSGIPTIDDLKDWVSLKYSPHPEAPMDAPITALMRLAKRGDQSTLYKVDLPDEQIAKMLDFNKPLKDQNPEIQKALQDLVKTDALGRPTGISVDPNMNGQWAYERLAGIRGAKYAAEAMREANIPGIRYLDQGSRSGGGTSNFVVFDPKHMNIIGRE